MPKPARRGANAPPIGAPLARKPPSPDAPDGRRPPRPPPLQLSPSTPEPVGSDVAPLAARRVHATPPRPRPFADQQREGRADRGCRRLVQSRFAFRRPNTLGGQTPLGLDQGCLRFPSLALASRRATADSRACRRLASGRNTILASECSASKGRSAVSTFPRRTGRRSEGNASSPEPPPSRLLPPPRCGGARPRRRRASLQPRAVAPPRGAATAGDPQSSQPWLPRPPPPRTVPRAPSSTRRDAPRRHARQPPQKRPHRRQIRRQRRRGESPWAAEPEIARLRTAAPSRRCHHRDCA